MILPFQGFDEYSFILYVIPDKFGAAMALVKSDIGGNITVRLSLVESDVLTIFLSNFCCHLCHESFWDWKVSMPFWVLILQ